MPGAITYVRKVHEVKTSSRTFTGSAIHDMRTSTFCHEPMSSAPSYLRRRASRTLIASSRSSMKLPTAAAIEAIRKAGDHMET